MWKDLSYSRLMLAIVVSLTLHLLLLAGFKFSFPSLTDNRDLIEVRVMLPQTLPIPPEKAATKSAAVLKQEKLIKPAKSEAEKPSELQSQASLEPVLPTESHIDAVSAVEQPESQPEAAENQPEASGLITKPKPYQYVQSSFDVYTDAEDVPNRQVNGRAQITYELLAKGEQYKIKSLIQAKGLVSLVVPDLLQTSDGFLDVNGLKPAHYLYKFGDKKNKTFSADFNWSDKKLNLHSEKGDQTFDLQDGTQDLLSFMYQFMFVPPLQNMQLNITNGKKLGVYDYTFEGEETLTTRLGEIKTIHILRSAPEGEKKTELWLALDYQHVPVKIRETNGDGKVYELLITNLNATTEPLLAQ